MGWEWVCLAVGIAGVSGATWLFPTLALALRRPRAARLDSIPPRSLSVVITAHNEAPVLPATLRSVHDALSSVKQANPALQVELLVGADGCTDETEAIAKAFVARVISSKVRRGKWRSLRSLIESAHGEVIVLCDAGTLWHPRLLNEALRRLADPNVLAIAPAYDLRKGSIWLRAHWALERTLKRLESAVGGPISLHGATVIYRAEPLREAMDWLGDVNWLNDDVVIPLTLRALHPSGEIHYLNSIAGRLRDADPGDGYRRRKRMAIGNLQWIRKVLPRIAQTNSVVACLALRRVFRVLWAYWLACCGIGALTLVFSPGRALAILVVTAAAIAVTSLAPAVFASLSAPVLFCRLPEESHSSWA